jgi:hypothetical protein
LPPHSDVKLQFNPFFVDDEITFFYFTSRQANSSIFVQSHSADFNCTTSASVTTTAAPKNSIGRWESGSVIEPLQIHLPASAAIKTEKIHSGGSSSSSSSSSSKTPSSSTKKSSKAAKVNKNINDCILNLHQQHQSKGDTKVEPNGTGCSRTLPLTWNQALQQLQSNVNCPPADTTTHTTATLLQIKREPCQVSEITTSNNLSFAGTPTLIKIEQKSPTTTTAPTITNISSSMDSTGTSNSGTQSGKFFLDLF